MSLFARYETVMFCMSFYSFMSTLMCCLRSEMMFLKDCVDLRRCFEGLRRECLEISRTVLLSIGRKLKVDLVQNRASVTRHLSSRFHISTLCSSSTSLTSHLLHPRLYRRHQLAFTLPHHLYRMNQAARKAGKTSSLDPVT